MRTDDPYADTYCPNAPGLYDYVLDVLDEVIEVFRPKRMHIGHDDLYSVYVCPRCRGYNVVDIYTNDIIRIHNHLAEKGVQTIIWSEKLLNSIAPSGVPVGGAEKPFRHGGETLFMIPATYPAADRIPKDILCMHWYWSIVRDWDNEFMRRGLSMLRL